MSTLIIEFCKTRAEAKARADELERGIHIDDPNAVCRRHYAEGLEEGGVPLIEVYQTPDISNPPVLETRISPTKLEQTFGVVLVFWRIK